MHPSRWRKITWALLVWCVAMVVWLAVVVLQAPTGEHCSNGNCMPAAVSGALPIVVLAIGGFFVLGLAGVASRPPRPPETLCPYCGVDVSADVSECSNCGTPLPGNSFTVAQ